MIKPKRLEKGDTIAVVSPSSGLWKRSELWRGIEALEGWGFKVKVGANAYNSYFYLAGTDRERAEDLMAAFRDDGVDAVFCSQGGYGAARILRYIDFEVIRKNPKIFLGFSDITSLHLAFHKAAGLVTFHGPSVTGLDAGTLTDYRRDSLIKAVCGEEPVGEIRMADPDKYLLKVTPGEAQGPVVGGNLSLVCATLGTPYEIDTEGKILFIEELDTEPWIMDHMLVHLLNAGKLQAAAGIVIGECSGCEPRKLDPGFFTQRSLEDIIFELLEPLGIPTIYGLPIGHTDDLATIPLGVSGYLNASLGVFKIEETATV